MFFLRQGATHKVLIGPVVAVGDGFTPVTTLALSTADEAEALVHDSATVVDLAAYTWAAVTTADGYYVLTLQSGITGTVGHMTVLINDDSLCLPVKAEFTVLEEAVYDAFYAASATGVPALAALEASVQTVDTVVDGIQTDLSNGTDGLGAIKAETALILTDTGTTLENHLTDIKGTGFVKDTHSLVDIEAYVDLIDDGTSGLAKIAADAALILGDTGELQTNQGNWLTATGFAVAGDAMTLTAAGVDLIWDETMAGHVTADTSGLVMNDLQDGGRLDLIVDTIAADVVNVDGIVPAAAGDAMALTAGAVDDVWDEDVDTSHQTAGTAGKKLDDAGAAADPWSTALPGAYGAGTAGKIVGDNINAPIATVDTVVDAIKAVTDLLPDAGALTSLATAASITALNDPSAATIADAVWDEAVAGHVGAGSFGATDAAILADTNELQTDWVNGGRLDLLLDAIPTTPMRGTDSAALASVCTEARLAELDAANLPADVDSALSRIPAALTGAGNMKSDALAVDGDTDAADRLQKLAQGNVFGTIGAASTTTNIVTSALDPAAAVTDQFKGRILTFKNDTTTANLRGQSTDITASTALGVFTVTALTTAPVSGDTFTIS